jgi:hypothetical protein
MTNNGVITSVYNTERYWSCRESAIDYFNTSVDYAAGDELSRYKRILKGLDMGLSYVIDDVNLSALPFATRTCSVCGTTSKAPEWVDTCICCGKKWSLSPVQTVT